MRVYLTGGLRIESFGDVVSHQAFDIPHAQLAVAYLVCERGRPVARSEVVELLAQGGSRSIDPDDLLSRLAEILSRLVPISEVRRTVETIEWALPPQTWVDIEAAADALHEAEAALRSDRVADAFGPSAIAHHIARRAFLPGERGPWVEAHRERLRGILLRALEARGKVFLWNNESALAIEAAREVVKLEPFRETGHQLLVRALAASGNTAEALRASQHFRQVLREALGVEPSAQTQQVFESFAPAAAPRPLSPFTTSDLTQTREEHTRASDLVSLLQEALGADYAVERELVGGMSRVFVAKERTLDRRVVIKVLPPALAEKFGVQRFLREVRLIARLQHPNIVPVLASGVIDGVIPYYTMPYLTGESLRLCISTGTPLELVRVASILRDIGRALGFAHGEGIIHRDIKPENILLGGGAAVVTDFGIAKALSDTAFSAVAGFNQALTGTGTALGTPSYMAPEQIVADQTMDHRADIYSFGVVAYELLGGRLPFGDRNPQERLAATLREAPSDVRLLRPETPSYLSTIVMQCLRVAPADRPQNMNDIVARFEASE